MSLTVDDCCVGHDAPQEGGKPLGYENRVPQRIGSASDRVDERTELWEAVVRAFEADGRDGVEAELTAQMREIRREFEASLARLDRML